MTDIPEQINRIYHLVEDLLCDGRFETVDLLLDSLNVDRVLPEVLVAWLTITLAAKDKLKTRDVFVQRCRACWVFQDQDQREALKRLE